jgi:hypothetical protein
MEQLVGQNVDVPLTCVSNQHTWSSYQTSHWKITTNIYTMSPVFLTLYGIVRINN